MFLSTAYLVKLPLHACVLGECSYRQLFVVLGSNLELSPEVFEAVAGLNLEKPEKRVHFYMNQHQLERGHGAMGTLQPIEDWGPRDCPAIFCSQVGASY